MPTVEDVRDGDGKVIAWKVYWDVSRKVLADGVSRKKTSRVFYDKQVKDLVVEVAREFRHSITIDDALSIAEDRIPAPPSSVLTLREFTETIFLPHQRWAAKNNHENRRRITQVILPVLGNYPLDQITAQVIDEFMTTLKATRKIPRTNRLISFATADDYFDNLCQIIRFAHADGLISANPLLRVRWQKNQFDRYDTEAETDGDKFFQPDQFELLLTHIREDFRPFLQFLLETGARFSEATALEVRHVGADGWVNIRETWEGEYPGLKDEIKKKKPKKDKDAGGRWVKITDELLAILTAMNRGKKPTDEVFVSSHNKRLRNQNFVQRYWEPAMIKIQQCPDHLPTRIDGRSKRPVLDKTRPSSCSCLGDQSWTSFTPHSLRHTFATWAIDSGMLIQDVARILGHKSITTTERVYAHQIARSRGQQSALLIDAKRLRMPDVGAKRAA